MKPFRPEKVGNVVREIVSDAIQNRLQDPRIAAMTSVTRVEVSGDLEWAKVYVSVLGEQNAQDRTLAALKHATGYVQKLLAKSLPIRQCPHLIFHLDQSLKKGVEVIRQIDASMREIEEAVREREGDRDSVEPLPPTS